MIVYSWEVWTILTNPWCFKIDDTTLLSMIINDKHLALRARSYSVNHHLKWGRSVINNNKKVLLRERKRHTARKRAQDADTPPPLAGPDPPPPQAAEPDPPCGWIDLWPDPLPAGPDPPGPAGPDPPRGWIDLWPDPPRCGQTNKVKLLPSRSTMYAGGNNSTMQFGLLFMRK